MPTTFGPDLEIGVPDIDAQHREIFDALRTLDAALAAPDDEAEDVALTVLSRYVFAHFETEERWMRQTAYPRTREHVSKHDEFAARLVAMTEERDEGGGTALLALRIRSAIAWVRDHIQGEDQLLGRHLEPRRHAAAGAPR